MSDTNVPNPNQQTQQQATPPVKPTPQPASRIADAVPAQANTAEMLQQLLYLMMQKEGREAQTQADVEKVRLARAAQREKSATAHVQKQLVKQARCRHLKGGKLGPKSGVLDYNLSYHRYINGEAVIKCGICAMKWKKDDTVEYLIRNNRKIANHTKIGWQRANEMFTQSTNTQTTSEIPYENQPQTLFNGVEIDGGLNGPQVPDGEI